MFLYRIFRFFLFIAAKVFFHLEVRGRKYIPLKGGFVLASNHSSILDPMLLGVACPRELNFAARDTLFRNPFFGALIFKVGAFPIKRWSADLAAIKESVRRLKIGRGLVVFPQGTRSSGFELNNISPGFVFLADKAKVPIVPVRIRGSRNAMRKGRKLIKPAKIRITFGKPVFIQESKDYEKVANDVFRQIAHLG